MRKPKKLVCNVCIFIYPGKLISSVVIQCLDADGNQLAKVCFANNKGLLLVLNRSGQAGSTTATITIFILSPRRWWTNPPLISGLVPLNVQDQFTWPNPLLLLWSNCGKLGWLNKVKVFVYSAVHICSSLLLLWLLRYNIYCLCSNRNTSHSVFVAVKVIFKHVCIGARFGTRNGRRLLPGSEKYVKCYYMFLLANVKFC